MSLGTAGKIGFEEQIEKRFKNLKREQILLFAWLWGVIDKMICPKININKMRYYRR